MLGRDCKVLHLDVWEAGGAGASDVTEAGARDSISWHGRGIHLTVRPTDAIFSAAASHNSRRSCSAIYGR